MAKRLMAVLTCCLLSCTGWAQDRRPPDLGIQRCEPGDVACADREYQRAKSINTARHEQLRRDMEQLLQLAQELKAAVDRSNENTLSLEVIRKTEQIEKLARNIRNKMKGP